MKHIMLIAGEASSDFHGACLARELFSLSQDIRITGMGGQAMAEAGVEVVFGFSDLSAIGIIEVLGKIPSGFKRLEQVVAFLKEEKPEVLVVIDFPEFNIRLGKIASDMGIPSIYYFPPTVWLWRKKRANTIAGYFKKVICVFPFEAEVFRDAGADVAFFGHPLLDEVKPSKKQEMICNDLNLDPDSRVLGILPGSRKGEIKRLLPIMLEATGKLLKKFPDIQPVIVLAPTIEDRDVLPYLESVSFKPILLRDHTYDVLSICHLVLIASGTATLEAACLGMPMVILYKLNWLTYLLGRLLIRTPFIGLPNIIAGKEVVPELVQTKASVRNVMDSASIFLKDDHARIIVQKNLAEVREKLGCCGATKKAAGLILEMAMDNQIIKGGN
ncbi:lipid-A-disaccharide synthase [Candidatus Desantisbacteria bacterium]|nr:lipid-A-disaccharide synthase [Candidatus Desantisbacteria bacterium]